MQGIILGNEIRYHHAKNYLEMQGHTFQENKEADFIIFPFMGEIDPNIYNDSYFAALRKDALIFSGVRSEYLTNRCKEYGLKYYPMMEERGITIKNAIPTSEGVISYLIKNRIDTIANSKILVIGYGVCGSDLSKKLKALGANVYALVRNREKEATAYADSITPIYAERAFYKPNFDVIINTVPECVMTNEVLQKCKGTLFIDIASKPYGFDMEFAKKLNEKSALLPGIPGKYAVRTAGEILGEYINQVLKNRGESSDIKR